MRVLVFGAGAVGRGFLGDLFGSAGADLDFVDVRPDIVDALNQAGGYRLTLLSNDAEESKWIENRGAWLLADPHVPNLVAQADLAAVCVGARNMLGIVPVLAKGLASRKDPLDLLLAENRWDAAEAMRLALDEQAPQVGAKLGLVETSIGRMLRIPSEHEQEQDPLALFAEPYCQLPVDAEAFVGAVPQVPGLRAYSPFRAYVARKLFVHNAGHAVAAYAGWPKGYRYIWESLADPGIFELTYGAMTESCLAIHKAFGLPMEGLEEHRDDLIARFQNRRLGDQVARIAADPVRKLARNDRLIGGLQLCLTHGIEPVNLTKGTALALRYNNMADPGSQSVRSVVQARGPEWGLAELSQLPAGDPILALVGAAYRELAI